MRCRRLQPRRITKMMRPRASSGRRCKMRRQMPLRYDEALRNIIYACRKDAASRWHKRMQAPPMTKDAFTSDDNMRREDAKTGDNTLVFTFAITPRR